MIKVNNKITAWNNDLINAKKLSETSPNTKRQRIPTLGRLRKTKARSGIKRPKFRSFLRMSDYSCLCFFIF